MNLTRSTLALSLLAAIGCFVAPAAHAQVAIDVIADSEVTFEGLVQADMYWYDADFALLNADGPDGRDGDYEMRRAELVLKGKGPGNIEWVMGYDAKADKWLDVNAKYKFGGNANHFVQVGQYKQLNVAGRAVLDEEQRLHRQGLDHQHLRRRPSPRRHVPVRRQQLGDRRPACSRAN